MKANDPTDPAEHGRGMAMSVADFNAGDIINIYISRITFDATF